ncbi:MAG: DUF2752 domain-containing protein [Roseburia sp.]
MPKKKKEGSAEVDTMLYYIGWGLAAFVLFAGGFLKYSGISIYRIFPPCLFRLWSGYYCPGCGGTRAAAALLRGDLAASFSYHPIVPLGVLLYLWFMLSQTIERLSGHRIRIGMHYRHIYSWLALAVILFHVIEKNLMR